MEIQLIPLTDAHRPLLENLMQFYLYDFSALVPLELDEEGRYHYPGLDLYFNHPDRFAFVASVGGVAAGFVFVHRVIEAGREDSWDMAEFFVLRARRRSGLGTALARIVFRRFPGPWQIRVLEANASAIAFWEHAVRGFEATDVHAYTLESQGRPWRVYTFTTPAI